MTGSIIHHRQPGWQIRAKRLDCQQTMALTFLFLLGVANFALHKAVLESGHPFLAQLPALFRSPGGQVSLIIEFLLLLGTMLMAANGVKLWLWGYIAYSSLNGMSAWLILTRRM